MCPRKWTCYDGEGRPTSCHVEEMVMQVELHPTNGATHEKVLVEGCGPSDLDIGEELYYQDEGDALEEESKIVERKHARRI
jgi:hypothetical protein